MYFEMDANWDVKLSNLAVKYQRFGGTYCLHV